MKVNFGVVSYPTFQVFVKSQAKRLWRIITILKNTQLDLSKNKKEVIVAFYKKGEHGGLVDRLKNIISAAYIAQKTNAELIIVHQTPLQLNSFLEVKARYIEEIKKVTVNPFLFKYLRNREFGEEISIEKVLNKFKKKRSFQILLDSSQQIPKQPEEWRSVFNSAMGLKYELNQRFREHFSNTVVHIRFFSLLGDFLDTPLTKINQESQMQLIDGCILRIEEIIKKQNEVLLVSDSNKFVEIAKNKFPTLKTTPGVAKHFDLNEGEDFTKEIMDFYCLLNAKEVINIAGSPLFSSNFSRFGGLIGKASFKRINVWTGENIVVEDFSQTN